PPRLSIADGALARQLPRPAQRVLCSLDEVGEPPAALAFTAIESGEALLPALADRGLPSAVFIGPGRSTLRVIESSRSNRRLSASSSFIRSSGGRSSAVVSTGLPGAAPGSIACKIALSARSSSW